MPLYELEELNLLLTGYWLGLRFLRYKRLTFTVSYDRKIYFL